MSCKVAAGSMTGWGGRVEPKPHAVRRMTTECTHGRLATSIRLRRNELVPPSRPPVAQLQPVLLSWWSGKVGRFLRKGYFGGDYVQSSRFAPGLWLAGSMMLTCSGSPELLYHLLS